MQCTVVSVGSVVSCRVSVYLCCQCVVMVVFWSVQLFSGVDERMHFCANSEDVEVFEVENAEI